MKFKKKFKIVTIGLLSILFFVQGGLSVSANQKDDLMNQIYKREDGSLILTDHLASYESGDLIHKTPTVYPSDWGTQILVPLGVNHQYGRYSSQTAIYYNITYRYYILSYRLTIINDSSSTMHPYQYFPFSYQITTPNGIPMINEITQMNTYNIGSPTPGYPTQISRDAVPSIEPFLTNDLQTEWLRKNNDFTHPSWPGVNIVDGIVSYQPSDPVWVLDFGEVAPGETKTLEFGFKKYTNLAPTGVLGNFNISMTYFELPGSTVHVNYVDTAGNTLAPETVLNQDSTLLADDPYTIDQQEIPGYQLVSYTMKEPDTSGVNPSYSETTTAVANDFSPINGYYRDNPQMVTFVYERNSSPVTVKYQDETGKELVASKDITGKYGDAYNESAIEINGYELVSPANVTGQITDQAQEIVFIYREKKPVTTNPTEPKEPSTPTEPGVVAPLPDTSGKSPNEVAKEDEKENSTKTNDISAKKEGSDSEKKTKLSLTLPNTGESHENLALSLLGVFAVLLFAGLFISNKKRHKS